MTAEVREQRGFAGAGVAGEDEDVWRAVGGSEGEHVAQQRLAAANDVALGALLDERFHCFFLFRKFIGRWRHLAGKPTPQVRVGFHAVEQVAVNPVSKRR